MKTLRRLSRRIYPCWYCGHADSHDLTHARGCPRLAPVPKEELLRIARYVEAGWARDERRDGNAIMTGWPDANRERGLLIDKSIAGTLSDDERARLEALQTYGARVLDELEDRIKIACRRLSRGDG